jgi:hypothetical protein
VSPLWRNLARLAAAVGLTLVALAVFFPVPRGRLLDGYLLFVGGLLLLGLARTTSRAGGAEGRSLYESALRRRRPRPERLRELARLEREVSLGATHAFDFHVRVRPHLRAVAEHRLESRRGLRLDEGSPAVRSLLGEEVWELLRPDLRPPEDRLGPGVPLPRMRAAVERLEAL